MSHMVRPDDKARKIAWAILGVPANMATKKSRKRREIDQRLLASETSRVR